MSLSETSSLSTKISALKSFLSLFGVHSLTDYETKIFSRDLRTKITFLDGVQKCGPDLEHVFSGLNLNLPITTVDQAIKILKKLLVECDINFETGRTAQTSYMVLAPSHASQELLPTQKLEGNYVFDYNPYESEVKPPMDKKKEGMWGVGDRLRTLSNEPHQIISWKHLSPPSYIPIDLYDDERYFPGCYVLDEHDVYLLYFVFHIQEGMVPPKDFMSGITCMDKDGDFNRRPDREMYLSPTGKEYIVGQTYDVPIRSFRFDDDKPWEWVSSISLFGGRILPQTKNSDEKISSPKSRSFSLEVKKSGCIHTLTQEEIVPDISKTPKDIANLLFLDSIRSSDVIAPGFPVRMGITIGDHEYVLPRVMLECIHLFQSADTLFPCVCPPCVKLGGYKYRGYHIQDIKSISMYYDTPRETIYRLEVRRVFSDLDQILSHYYPSMEIISEHDIVEEGEYIVSFTPEKCINFVLPRTAVLDCFVIKEGLLVPHRITVYQMMSDCKAKLVGDVSDLRHKAKKQRKTYPTLYQADIKEEN